MELAHPADGTTVLDLGLEGPGGYVGWSGGARRTFVVSERWSTPGYLPMPMTGGEWHVLLGLHRVHRDGVVARLEVRAVTAADVARHRAAEPHEVPPARRAPRARRLPELDGKHWLAGDLHAHTTHSDGALPLTGLAALAVSRGLDFLAVTDHNTTSHHAHLPSVGRSHGITLVPGQEVTRDTGHANAFGDIGFVDFRMPQAGWGAQVAARGGVLSVNHPLAADCAWLEAGSCAGRRGGVALLVGCPAHVGSSARVVAHDARDDADRWQRLPPPRGGRPARLTDDVGAL